MSGLFRDLDKPEVVQTAELSECGMYRYMLARLWNEKAGTVNFIMLNPSTADHRVDDLTIRRCVGFAKSWGFGELVVTNLYPFRATDPRAMKSAANRRGPVDVRGHRRLNDMHIARWAAHASLVVCAWGNHAESNVARDALILLRSIGKLPHVLRLSKGGNPSHPLYLPSSLSPIAWRPWNDQKPGVPEVDSRWMPDKQEPTT